MEFELSVDLETAANDVRDKVSRAQRFLPRDCDPPTVSKADADADPIIQITVQSDTRSLLELIEIAELTIKESLQTIQNVSSVGIWGETVIQCACGSSIENGCLRHYAYGCKMLLIKKMWNYHQGNIEGDKISLSIRTLGLLITPEDFNNLIIKEDKFRIVRFGDIGKAELDAENRQNILKRNGQPMVSTVIIPVKPALIRFRLPMKWKSASNNWKKDFLPKDVKWTLLW